MKRKMPLWCVVLVVAVAMLPSVGLTQGGDLGNRILALRTSLAQDAKDIRKYEWVETTIVSMKGEEKARTQNRCYYGADGNLMKVELSKDQADMPGGLRGRKARQKKEEITEYMQKAVAMIKSYVPPDPAKLQALYQGGKVGYQVLEPGRRGRVEFRDYQVPGDLLGIEVNLTNNRLLGAQINTYLEGPEDKVSLSVQFARLADGTGYPAKVAVDAPTQKVTVVTQNAGYRPMAR